MTERQYFGTDGIRGRVDSELMNPEFITRLGWAAGKVLRQQSQAPVLIGSDTRESCPKLVEALSAGLNAAGVDVHLLGVIPTPCVAYLTKRQQAAAGAVVSASHNPFYDNGIKFFNSDGMKLSDEIELAIERELVRTRPVAAEKHTGKISHTENAAELYQDYCYRHFPASLVGLTIVVDCANGATHRIAPNVLKKLGATVTIIHDQPDGENINLRCGATQLASLQNAVVDQRADLGIAFDGDGDRVLFVDRYGDDVDGDEILAILAMNRPDVNGVVGTVMSNLGLQQALTSASIDFVRAQVGDRYVLEALLQNDWVLGGEASGHLIDLSLTTTGDGLLTALQVLNVIREHEQPLHELKNVMIKRPQVLINVPVTQCVNLQKFPSIKDAIQTAEHDLQDRGRVLLRPSGTEPVVRVMVEGNDPSEVEQVARSLADVVAHTFQ